MTSTEQLVEAVVYAEDNGIEWFEVFDSIEEALKVIRAAKKEEPDEGQIVCLLSAMDVDLYESRTSEVAYRETLQEMYKELKR